MPVITLTQQNSVAKDVYTYQPSPTTNYNTQVHLSYGVGNSVSEVYRGHIKFDLGLIPNDAIINSAYLVLQKWSGTASFVTDIHKVTSDWTDTTLNWNTNPSFEPTPSSSITLPTTASTQVSIDIKDIAQSWVNGSSINYGLLLKAQNETIVNTLAQFRSFSYTTDVNVQPKLTIDYTIPTTGKKQVEYVGNGGIQTSSTASISVLIPATAQPGDLLVAQILSNTSSAITIPANWALKVDRPVNTSRQVIATKTMASGEPNLVLSSNATLWGVVIHVLRNVKNTQAANHNILTATSSFFPPATAATTDDTMFFLLNTSYTGASFNPPLGYSESSDVVGGGGLFETSFRYMYTDRDQTTGEMTSTCNANAYGTSTVLVLEPFTNNPPTLTLSSPSDNQTLSEGSSVLLGNTNDFILRITPNDTDASDTLEYTVLLRGVTKQPYTACAKGVAFDYTIPYADLLLGNNAVQVTVKDNNGGEVTINFTLRNKAPSTTSQQSVKEVLTALGYPNTSATCLNDLKPSDYALATLSLGEILNSLD